jgi:hypothetical protein
MSNGLTVEDLRTILKDGLSENNKLIFTQIDSVKADIERASKGVSVLNDKFDEATARINKTVSDQLVLENEMKNHKEMQDRELNVIRKDIDNIGSKTRINTTNISIMDKKLVRWSGIVLGVSSSIGFALKYLL